MPFKVRKNECDAPTRGLQALASLIEHFASGDACVCSSRSDAITMAEWLKLLYPTVVSLRLYDGMHTSNEGMEMELWKGASSIWTRTSL